FEDLDVALQLQGDNREFKIRCNQISPRPQSPVSAWINIPKAGKAAVRDQGNEDCMFDHQQAAGNIWTDDCPKPTHTHLNLFNYPNDMYVDPSIYFVYYGHFEDLQDKEGSRPFCATDWWNNDNTNYPCQ